MKVQPITINMSDETREQLKAIAQRLSNLGYDVQNPKHPDSISLSAVLRILAASEYHSRNITSGPSVRIE